MAAVSHSLCGVRRSITASRRSRAMFPSVIEMGHELRTPHLSERVDSPLIFAAPSPVSAGPGKDCASFPKLLE